MKGFPIILLPLMSEFHMSACVSQTSTDTITTVAAEIPTQITVTPATTASVETPPEPEVQDPIPYNPLISPEQETRMISGVSLTPNQTAPLLRINLARGTIGPDGRSLDFSDTVFTFQDPDGQNSAQEFSDGTLTMIVDQADYQFSARYAIEDGANATAGVFGIATSAADMPMSGTATFSGFGEVTEIYPSNFPDTAPRIINHTASSEVDVNCATGKVNAALQVDEPVIQLGSQIDRLSARGMSLNGSLFSGTNVKMFKNGERVRPTGTSADNDASGQFFGAKRDSSDTLTPAEVGGVIVSSSQDGLVFGTFIAK